MLIGIEYEIEMIYHENTQQDQTPLQTKATVKELSEFALHLY